MRMNPKKCGATAAAAIHPSKSFMDDLQNSLSCTEQDLRELNENCIHIEAVSEILCKYDSYNGIVATIECNDVETLVESEILALQHNNSMVCVRFEGRIGFVNVEFGKLKCCNCLYDSNNCSHIKHIRKVTNHPSEYNDEIPDVVFELLSREKEWQPSVSYQHRPVSTFPVQFDIPVQLARNINAGYRSFLKYENDHVILMNEECHCAVCGLEYDHKIDGSSILYTCADMIPCQVFADQCPLCKSLKSYDGACDGILNMGKFLVGYDVLRDYMYHFLLGNSCTLFGYYSIWKQKNLDCGNIEFATLFSYQRWRSSWYAFLSLLDIDYEKWNVCEKCGTSPRTVVCDGTSLGFRKQLILLTSDKERSGETIKRASQFQERMAIDHSGVRTLVEKWTKSLSKSSSANLSMDEIDEMERLLEEKYPALFQLYHWIKVEGENVPVKQISKFLLCVCSRSPVCAYIPPSQSCCNLLTSLCLVDVKAKPAFLLELRRGIPFLYDILCSLPMNSFPLVWQEIFDWLYNIACNPFVVENFILGPEVSQYDDMLSFFPTLPKRRERGLYAMDRGTARDETCTKKSFGHPTLTPGIFTIYCPHGINYGFQAMESHESPNVPFTVFRSRFMEAPQTIIYDNSCNLHAYSLNRDPVHFKDTKFLVDRFHWRNHKGCCLGYNISQYVQYDCINSQVNEQQNATIKKLRSQLSYMGQHNFMMHCKFFFWFRNRLSLEG